MSRVYLHRYKVLNGSLLGQVFDGQEIGSQKYLDQLKIEGFATDTVYGVWLNEPKVKIPLTEYRNIILTDEGLNYNNEYMDLCIPFDRFNNEIFVGDTIYISTSNNVVPCIVEKISKKPFMANYGIVNRKITARPIEGGPAKTIGDPRSTVKVDK
jgi:hypothetical protein